MAGSRAGARAIIAAMLEILQNHLAAYMRTIEIEEGLAPFTIDTPDPVEGMTASRLFGRDSHSALTIVKSDGETPNQARGLGFPVRTNHAITVKIAWTGDADTDTEYGLNLVTRAVEAAIMERWEAYYADTCWYDCEAPTSIEDGSSIRAQFQALGWDSISENVINLTDYCEITFLCRQSVQRSRFTTKDLLP